MTSCFQGFLLVFRGNLLFFLLPTRPWRLLQFFLGPFALFSTSFCTGPFLMIEGSWKKKKKNVWNDMMVACIPILKLVYLIMRMIT